MNRRRFLSLLGAGTAGAVIGGTATAAEAGTRDREIERSGQAGPVGIDPAGTRRLIWSVETEERAIAVTFDDGPYPDLTPRVLEILATFGVPATFNVMGYNAVEHAELIHREVAAGHEIGNHTWTHEDLAFQTPEVTRTQIEQSQREIDRVAGVRTRLFRPPRGELTGTAARVAARLGYDILLWSVDRGPPGTGTPAAVAEHLVARIRPGAIVGLHDGIGRATFRPWGMEARDLRARREVELQALPQFLERALERGYRLLTVSGLVALEGRA